MKDGPQEQMKQVSQDAGGPVAEDESKKRGRSKVMEEVMEQFDSHLSPSWCGGRHVK